MPKIARAYNNRDGQTSEMLSYSNSFRYEQQSYGYSSSSYRRTSKAEYDERYRHLREENRHNKRPRKRKTLAQSIVSGSIILFLFACVMPFAFNNITKAMFVPTPYKNIQTDLKDLSFPTHNYLSNAWSMGNRDFRFAASEKMHKWFQ